MYACRFDRNASQVVPDDGLPAEDLPHHDELLLANGLRHDRAARPEDPDVRVQLGSQGGQVRRLGDAGVGPVAGVLDGAHEERRLAEVQEEGIGHLRVRLAQRTVFVILSGT